MLGWHISVFKQASSGSSPARADSEKGRRLAVWQTGWGGLKWFDELVTGGQAIGLGGDGYPYCYTVRAKYLRPQIARGPPPEANETWICGPYDIITEHWEGRTVIDQEALDACQPDEWLLVVAWDES